MTRFSDTQQLPAAIRPPLDVMPHGPDCTDDEVLDLVAAANGPDGPARNQVLWSIAGSTAMIAAICRQVERLDGERLAARDQLQALTLDLETTRDQLAVAHGIGERAMAQLETANHARRAAEELLEAGTSDEVLRLTSLCARLADENDRLRRQALDAVSARIAASDPVLQADREAECAARRDRGISRAQRQRCEALAALRSEGMQWDVSGEPDTQVVDVDPPTVGRARTVVITPRRAATAYGHGGER